MDFDISASSNCATQSSTAPFCQQFMEIKQLRTKAIYLWTHTNCRLADEVIRYRVNLYEKTQQSWIFPQLYIGILQHCTCRRLYRSPGLLCSYHAGFFLKIVENVCTEHWITWKPVCNQEIKYPCKPKAGRGSMKAGWETWAWNDSWNVEMLMRVLGVIYWGNFTGAWHPQLDS